MLASQTVIHNRYRLQEQLSDNPVRQTWLALDLEIERLVVVKFLAVGGALRWEDMKLFEREALVLEQLDHPRIPKYYDYFSLDEQTAWFGLVQAHIPGVSLKHQLDVCKRFTPEQVYQIAEDVLEILQYLHDLNPPVFHRDIKPSNLIWGENNRVYLVDFGAVQMRPPTAGATFTVVGTYGYAPMEQYGGQVAPASDLYALGATLIHLLAGLAPSDLPQKELCIQFSDRVGPSVPAQLIAWLEKMTQPSPENRFRTAREALSALKAQTRITYPQKRTAARLAKSANQLHIEVPSSFDLEVLRPASHRLHRWGKRGRDAIAKILKRFGLPRGKTLVSGGAIALFGLFLLNSLTSLSLVERAFHLTLILLSIPISLLGLSIPFLLVAWIVVASQRSDYFEKTSVVFNSRQFSLWRQSPGNERRERGELEQIKSVTLGVGRDAAGRMCQGIAIITEVDRKVLFFSSTRSQLYFFGQQLPEEELNWLVQEIQEWLALHP
ncbi:serine/threonine protein kinase [Lusitaniella coriacea LEGE 07157]|uniref:Serine/threonine protein kinase n=1 Tax=Lusitaniella coriacea LEGE 07157 TaxID=945747 RepID=A0A8J7J3R6_9CYAN|nr:serine/threonine-protein kinase [Lusitaniella coriacea]MBE9117109.1 serine/threonine protein kinase [Lusitaniella coriacea LEGE 07157]